MRIVVTEKDIKLGRRCSTHSCPVALAISRHFRDVATVGVFGWDAVVSDRGTCRGRLPAKVGRWINRFDRKQRVAPIIFTWNPMGEV